jgi:hypothetical protein
MLTVIMLYGSNAAAQDSKTTDSKSQDDKTQTGKTRSGIVQNRKLGLGFILGEPTGLSLKKWIGDTTAIDGSASWSFGRGSALQLHADYLLHLFNLFKVGRGKLPLYYGLGGRVKFDDDSKAGIRFPLGISYILENEPLDIFFEVAPILNLAPRTEFDLNGAVGVRYYFW